MRTNIQQSYFTSKTYEGIWRHEKLRRGIQDCIVPGCDKKSDLNIDFTYVANSPGTVTALLGYLCYICGRQYGSKSIDIQEKQCLVIFWKQQLQLPPEEWKEVSVRPQTADLTTREARNAFATKTYNERVMETCKECNRTLNRSVWLEKHMRGCDVVKKNAWPVIGVRDCITLDSVPITTD